MQVKLNCGRAGNGFANNPGDVVDVDPHEASRMISRGSASLVNEADKASLPPADEAWSKAGSPPVGESAPEPVADDDHDEDDAINGGDEAAADAPATALAKSKARKATEAKAKAQ